MLRKLYLAHQSSHSYPFEYIFDLPLCRLWVLFECKLFAYLRQHPLYLLTKWLKYGLFLRAVTEFDVHLGFPDCAPDGWTYAHGARASQSGQIAPSEMDWGGALGSLQEHTCGAITRVIDIIATATEREVGVWSAKSWRSLGLWRFLTCDL